jgi:ABC-2 type transport system permease protein
MSDALRAELTKLRSVRSTTWALLAILGLTIALGVVSSSTSHTDGGRGEDIVMVSLVGVYFAQIVGGLVAGVSIVATVGTFYAGQSILRGNGFVDGNGYPAASLADGQTLRTVAIAAAYLVLLAVLSLAAAAILRDTAAAISVLLGVLFVPWIVGGLLPERLANAFEEATPMAGIAAQEQGAPIGPWAGIGVTSAWAAAALLVALWLVRRRDA